MVDFVREFVEVDVILLLSVFSFAIHIDGVSGEHRGEFDVLSALTDGEAHLIGVEEHIGAFFFFVDHDVVHACRVERTLDVEHRVGGEGNDVDVFVFEFAHDAADAVTAHAHAGAYGVDVGVVAFHRDFGAFSRESCHIVEHNHAFCDFRDFATQELSQIHGASA